MRKMRYSCYGGSRVARVAIASLVVLTLAALTLPERVHALPCGPTWTTVAAPPLPTRGELFDVVAFASNDAWAVGIAGTDFDHRPLAAHWDGSAWSIVPAAIPAGAVHTRLLAVGGAAGGDVWAVGHTFILEDGRFVEHPLIERFDAATATWSAAVRRDIGGSFYDVVALSPTDVWAVGTYDRITSLADEKPLIEHWDGRQWSMVPSPGPGYRSGLWGVAAVSADDVWAVGAFDAYVAPGQSATRPLAQHWDGTEWQLIPAPSVGSNDRLNRIAALSSSDLWAVGGSGSSSLFERWDGRGWSVTPAALPRISSASSVRRGVAAAGPGDVWAVGANPLVAHWDGRGWTKVAVRYWDQPSKHTTLNAATATSSGDVWGVGTRHDTLFREQARPHIARICPIRVSDAGFEPSSSTVDQGSDVAWSMPTTSVGNHSVSDASGLGLFDSGLRSPGSSYTATLIAAGKYSVTDRAGSASSVISVPLRVSPRRGSPTTTFNVTWASEPPSEGHVFDVQLKRPSAAAYATWRRGTTTTNAGFTPDSHPGTYRFRARLRSVSNDHASGWSPVTDITVE